ncbi:hypothetical protein I6N96_19060 [Enterococcus sp. BWM-S5]|uniref:Uncharacterized protein n=1 Tax=Enterococcus larvae TaxID=2794352 RepID=A0ABS4CQE4_9ENTE|nr:hypothetical protein [Enterococcus larvae]MBP1048398.1 hypothetical protein [Enterococcus larvae]
MENKIKRLVAQTVVKSTAGGGAGSTLVLEFEDTSYIFIWCSWRIEQGKKVIVTSSDTVLPTESNDSPNGLIGEKSPVLKGRKVKNVYLSPQYDLEIVFDNEYKLRIFCDIGPSRDDYDINWELNIPTDNISIEISNHFKERMIEENFND